MLKITLLDSARECRFRLEGKLSGPWVRELEQCWQTAASTTAGRATTVDLREVDFVDEPGRSLLRAMHAEGVRLAAATPVIKALIKEITGKPEVAEETKGGRRQPLRKMAIRLCHPLLCAALLLAACAALAYGAPPPAAEEGLERYLSAAGVSEQRSDTAMRVEIQARLPRMHRSGVLQVIEYIPRRGRAVFRVMGFQGDDTVKRQVISRYLAAEADARGRDSAPVALSRANYTFRFLGSADYLGRDAWVWQVKPRAKRLGLFSGELWIDARTAAPLRQWGQFVKSPSIFIRGMRFVRDYDVESGAPRRLIVNLDTRIAGAAELTVWYEPVATGPAAIAAFCCATVGDKPEPTADVLNRNPSGLDACAL